MTTVWIPDAITYKRYHCIVDNSDIIWCSSLISTALPVLSKIFNKHPFILECRKIITPGIKFKEVWFLLVTFVSFFRFLFSQITMLSSSVFDFSCLYVDIIGLTIFQQSQFKHYSKVISSLLPNKLSLWVSFHTFVFNTMWHISIWSLNIVRSRVHQTNLLFPIVLM